MSSTEVRPCFCNRVTSGKFLFSDDCVDCWAYYFDPHWAVVWGKAPGELPPVVLLEDKDPGFIPSLLIENGFDTLAQEVQGDSPLKITPAIACINLGVIISRRECNCPLRFVHRCDIHKQCVRGLQEEVDVRSCLGCSDYQADTPYS